MKKIVNALTCAAMVVFVLALTAIESLNPWVLAALMISGGWLVAYTMIYNEMRRMGERR